MVSCTKCNSGFTSKDPAALRCSKCTAAYHRKCSDITVPEFAEILKSWLCSNCASKSVTVPSTSDATMQSNGQWDEHRTTEVKAFMVTATKSSSTEVLKEMKPPDSSPLDSKIVNKGIQSESEKKETKEIQDSTVTVTESSASGISKDTTTPVHPEEGNEEMEKQAKTDIEQPTEFKSETTIEEFDVDTKTTSVSSDLSLSRNILKHEPLEQPEKIKIDEATKSFQRKDTLEETKTSAGPELPPKPTKSSEDDKLEQQSDAPHPRPEDNETDPVIFIKAENDKDSDQHNSYKDEFPTCTLSRPKSAEKVKAEKELLVPSSDPTSNVMDPKISDYLEDVKIFRKYEGTEAEVAMVTTREEAVSELTDETKATMLPHEASKFFTESSLTSDSNESKTSDSSTSNVNNRCRTLFEIDSSEFTDTKAIATNLTSSIIDVSATQPTFDRTSNIRTDPLVSTHNQSSVVESEKQDSTLNQIPASIFSETEINEESKSCVSLDETSEIPVDASSSNSTSRWYHRACQTVQHTIAGINAKMQEMMIDISDLKEKQDVNYKKQCNIMNEMHHDPVKVEALEQKLESNMKENENLRNKTNLLKERIKGVESIVVQMNQESRGDLFEIHGLPVQQDENLNEIIMKIGHKLEVNIQSDDIVFCRRISCSRKKESSTPNTRPSIVLVKVRTRQLRNEILKKRKIVREFSMKDLYPEKSDDSLIYLNESLSFHLRQVYAYARKLRKNGIIKFVWISHGKVLVRRRDSEPAFSVTHIHELQSLGSSNRL